MDNEQEYITITQVAKDLEWNKATVYDWIKTLGIQTHRFVRNRNTFLHIADAARLKEIKEKPWTAGPNTARTARRTPEKSIESSISALTSDYTSPTITSPQKRNVETPKKKRDYSQRGAPLPEGCIL